MQQNTQYQISFYQSYPIIKNSFSQLAALQNDRLMSKDSSVQKIFAEANRHLNRYLDIFPFDHNIFKFKDNPNRYTNASLLTSLFGTTQFLVSQGPLEKTVRDFWEMLYEANSFEIVMLTPLEEKRRPKCFKYWPDLDKSLEIAPEFIITCIQEKVLQAGIISRTFLLHNGVNERKVEMIHFLDWPDHEEAGVQPMIELINITRTLSARLRQEHGIIGPPIVHCSAGVGRSGTFCTIQGIYSDFEGNCVPGPYFNDTKSIGITCFPENDIISWTVNHLRCGRATSVQSEVQFALCYEVLKNLFPL